MPQSTRSRAEETSEFRTVSGCEELSGKIFSYVNRWVLYILSGIASLAFIGYTISNTLNAEVTSVRIRQEGTTKDIDYVKERIDDIKTEQLTMKKEILDEIRKAK